jgi:hypothetical protein
VIYESRSFTWKKFPATDKTAERRFNLVRSVPVLKSSPFAFDVSYSPAEEKKRKKLASCRSSCPWTQTSTVGAGMLSMERQSSPAFSGVVANPKSQPSPSIKPFDETGKKKKKKGKEFVRRRRQEMTATAGNWQFSYSSPDIST